MRHYHHKRTSVSDPSILLRKLRNYFREHRSSSSSSCVRAPTILAELGSINHAGEEGRTRNLFRPGLAFEKNTYILLHRCSLQKKAHTCSPKKRPTDTHFGLPVFDFFSAVKNANNLTSEREENSAQERELSSLFFFFSPLC